MTSCYTRTRTARSPGPLDAKGLSADHRETLYYITSIGRGQWSTRDNVSPAGLRTVPARQKKHGRQASQPNNLPILPKLRSHGRNDRYSAGSPLRFVADHADRTSKSSSSCRSAPMLKKGRGRRCHSGQSTAVLTIGSSCQLSCSPKCSRRRLAIDDHQLTDRGIG
jgi:hypothetical protein